MAADECIVNDVTGLNPVRVRAVARPTSVEEVQDAIRRWNGPLSVGGGRFSMGGQTASPDSLHIDLRGLNRILELRPVERRLRVQAGVRWCDIQRFVDPHGLAVKIMQSYANFTVGGSLSVNVHGRYVGLGPLILSVCEIRLVDAEGCLHTASPQQSPEMFYGAIGGYSGLGVIVEAELELAENVRLERVARKLPLGAYVRHFREQVRSAPRAVFHNADLYPPRYVGVRSVTWQQTDKAATVPARLVRVRREHPLQRYFLWAVSETPFGKWRKEFVFDPLLYLRSAVHWRNYEAGYDVAELEPLSRRRRTYVLQEYFVPVARFEEFVPRLAEILRRHRVNMINISIRHAMPDPGSLLAWAPEEVFAFVLYYKQRVRDSARGRVAVWTRELIEAALAVGGRYYLPYQAHATPEQFARAYPRAPEFFALKRRLDPQFRFRNVLWDTYYAPTLVAPAVRTRPASEFQTVFADVRLRDGFYRFLQNIYRLYPEDRFHALIQQACATHDTDEAIYRYVQAQLPALKPFLADLFYALPSLAKQKREMGRQTRGLLAAARVFDGYVEIGSTGRYVRTLRGALRLRGATYLVNDVAPGNSPVDLVERGGLGQVGRFVPLADYAPIRAAAIPDASVELVSCYIGLHHAPAAHLDAFIGSIARVLKPGGAFVLRDHDVRTPDQHAFVSLAHTVFNAGLGLPWESNPSDVRLFVSVDEWCRRLAAHGLHDSGARLLQDHDPTDNTLMLFTKGVEGARA